ncbi:GNAT family protein [Arthrobacter sp. efr-133-R2A-120]|uniref:GNAT family N-acetyltransferase n=1 Tax=Arthrobacter sp. efr-133-R2A-120 TaxID=3040277 RepID=UPI00254FCA65|nr:GNAT family protein [Arthrobacter sp. efr-133-R2A-120]
MTLIAPVTLDGRFVTLEPLSAEHHDGLVDAAKDGELWNLWYTSVPTPEGMAAEIDRRLGLQEQGSMLPFATRLKANGKLIGMTTYMNIDAATPRVEIGSTWNAASAHGSGSNPDSKLLLLRHAFETLGCPAVEFRTHWLNHQSREAIARLGAKQDGVLRNHSRTLDGVLRDTVVFSILEHEWPAVRTGLEFRLAKRS